MWLNNISHFQYTTCINNSISCRVGENVSDQLQVKLLVLYLRSEGKEFGRFMSNFVSDFPF